MDGAGDPGVASGAGAVWVVGDAATVTGWRLAGLRGRVAASAAEARAALDALGAEGAALVLVTEALCATLGGVEAVALAGLRPVIAVIPSVAEPRPARTVGAEIRRAVQRALGLPVEGRG